MCKFIGKSNELILCRLSQSEIQSLVLPWKLQKRQILPVNQNLSSVYYSLAKFYLVSCNLSLDMIANHIYSQTAKTMFNE